MISRSTKTLMLVLATALAVACQRQGQGPAVPAALPLGLTCDQCEPLNREQCARAEEAQVTAIVAEPQLLSTKESCSPDPPGPNFPSICTAKRLYRFARVEFLRAPPGASVRDEFESLTLYSEVYTAELEKWPGTGPVLRSGRRYVIFAVPDRKDMGWPADWYINLACDLPQNGQRNGQQNG